MARTFTLEEIETDGGVPARGTDASTNVEEFQTYDPSRINDRVIKAVEKTRGEVVKYQDKYIKAWFLPMAAVLQQLLPKKDWLIKKSLLPTSKVWKIRDLPLQKKRIKNWRVAIPLATVRESVRKTAGNDPGPIASAQIVKKGRFRTGNDFLRLMMWK